jgi:hypothetical protein
MRHLRAILLLPGMVTVVVPAAILYVTGVRWPPSPWQPLHGGERGAVTIARALGGLGASCLPHGRQPLAAATGLRPTQPSQGLAHGQAARGTGSTISPSCCKARTESVAPDYWPVDCAVTIENMLLAAHSLGLGAVWCGIYPRDTRVAGFRKLLMLPERTIPHSVVVIGYPGEHPPGEDRFRPDQVHRNAW